MASVAALILLPSGCTDKLNTDDTQTESEGWVIPFSAPGSEDVRISTKSTLDAVAEGNVFNVFVFIFDADGHKLQNVFYDSTNKDTQANVTSTSVKTPCWYVANSNTSDPTNGSIKLPAPIASGCTIYAIANIDADMINVSSLRLRTENLSLTDLKNFVATLNQDIVSRNGYFPMSGSLSGVTVTSTGFTFSGGDTLYLERMDARIEFEFTVDHTAQSRTYYDDNGTSYTTSESVKSFTPISWQVVNVPKSVFALGYSDRGESETSGHDSADYLAVSSGKSLSDYFFDTAPIAFESINDDGTSTLPNPAGGSFSFYMSENRRPAKATAPDINSRSKQEKYSGTPGEGNDGKYVVDPDTGRRSFVYADDYSTYVVVKGTVEMSTTSEAAGQSLTADIQYIIHLGDFGSSVSDFNVKRNTDYKYTVTVKGFNKVRMEVETAKAGNPYGGYNQEDNSGASGAISVAKEEIAICDCHYVSKTLTFHFSNINDNLTWRVLTPYCEGEPDPVTGSTETCQDYKWVHFRLNKKNSSGTYFSDQRRKYSPREWESYERVPDNLRTAHDNLEGDGTDGLGGYHNDGIMDVTQLVSYIKEQHKLASDENGNFVAGASDFDNGTDADGNGKFTDTGDEDPKISVTVFVDEYYYDRNPVTGAVPDDLWKTFVNQPDRYIYILSKSGISRDEDSRMSLSVTAIQQHAIQSIFNTDRSVTSLKKAWGLERTDEFDGKWEYMSGLTVSEGNVSPAADRGNTDLANGLRNTLREWDLCSATDNTFISPKTNWSKYMNFEVNNDTPQLDSPYAYLRYSCMTRNRDNNGDGVIDRDEMRWYMASTRQLIGIYVGAGIIDNDSRLYHKSATQMTDSDQKVWMQHVFSSTRFSGNSNDPLIIWAEEGISTSAYGEAIKWGNADKAMYSVRCLRNLGMEGDHSLADTPQFYLVQDPDGKGNNLRFSGIYLNEDALRYFTSRELDMGDENSEENKLYKTFEFASSNNTVTHASVSSNYFKAMNDVVSNAIDAGGLNPVCPAGYRFPNQRELAVALFYNVTLKSVSRTSFSFGPMNTPGAIGNTNGQGNQYKYGFSMISYGSGSRITVNDSDVGEVRCVRDVKE